MALPRTRLQPETPKFDVSRCCPGVFFRLKTEESSHITHIVEVKEAVGIQQVKEAVKQPIKEAVRNSRSKKLCQTAKPELLKATTPFSKKLLGNSQVKEAVLDSRGHRDVRDDPKSAATPLSSRDVCVHCHYHVRVHRKFKAGVAA